MRRLGVTRSETFLLLGALLVGAGLRLWGIGFGLPNTVARPDEGRLVGVAAGFTLRHDLNPHFFSYPTLFPETIGAIYAARCAGAVALGAFPTIGRCAESWFLDWGPLFLTARLVSAFSGVCAVPLVFFIGRRLYPNAALPSAALVSVVFLHVRDSHFGVTDVAMTTLVLTALLLLLRADERPTVRRYGAAGLVLGLAAATKYNAVLLIAAGLISAARVWHGRLETWRAAVPRMVALTVAAAATFLIATPYALLDRGEFLRDTRFESWHLQHANIPLSVGWRYHALVTLPLGVGWPLLVVGVAGIVWTILARPRPAALVFTFPILYYAVAGSGYTVFVRYMIPVVPFLCLGAGAAIALVADRAWRPRWGARVVGIGLTILCGLPTASKAIAFDRVLARTDSRVLAADWAAQHVEPNASILFTGEPLQLADRGVKLPYDIWRWNGDAGRLLRGGERPGWIIVEESPLVLYSPHPNELTPILDRYVFRHRIVAMHGQTHVYDQQDAFFLPLDGFTGVLRPGPNFSMYSRRQ